MGWLFSLFFMLALGFVIALSFLVMGFPSPQSTSLNQPQVVLDSTPQPGHVFTPGAGRGFGGVRRTVESWREWRRSDPTLIKSLWKSKMGNGIRKQLGNAEVYIMLALLIGLGTVVVGCWLSDNCWSPEPEETILA